MTSTPPSTTPHSFLRFDLVLGGYALVGAYLTYALFVSHGLQMAGSTAPSSSLVTNIAIALVYGVAGRFLVGWAAKASGHRMAVTIARKVSIIIPAIIIVASVWAFFNFKVVPPTDSAVTTQATETPVQ